MSADQDCSATPDTPMVDIPVAKAQEMRDEIEHLRGLVRAIHRTDPHLVMQRVGMNAHEYAALQRALGSGGQGGAS